jgi:MFS family permease
MTRAQRWTLLAAIVASGIVFLDSTVVNLALKRMGEELPTTTSLGVLEAQAYIGSGYLAVLAALLIIAGALADRYGRRRIFTIGLASFGVISVLCGLAPTLEILIIARLLQGAAGALLVPGSLAIISAAFDGASRARAFGLWAGSTSALTLLGPIIGGLLVDNVSWRAAFLINVPLVGVALWAGIRHVAESRDESATGHFDWVGSAVGAVAVGGLAFGAIRGQESQWADSTAWLSLAIGAVCLVLFPILMAVRPHPLVPLSLFRNREFATINLATFLIYGALYVGFTYTALLYQGTLGYTATGAAVIGLPAGLLIATVSARVGDQQRPLAGRSAAPGRRDLRRDHGVVLHDPRDSSARAQRGRPKRSSSDRAAESAEEVRSDRGGRGRQVSVGRRVPPRVARVRGSHDRRSGDVLRRAPARNRPGQRSRGGASRGTGTRRRRLTAAPRSAAEQTTNRAVVARFVAARLERIRRAVPRRDRRPTARTAAARRERLGGSSWRRSDRWPKASRSFRIRRSSASRA